MPLTTFSSQAQAIRLMRRLSTAADPYALYDRLRELGPVTPLPALGITLVTGHRECRQVLRDPAFITPDVAWRDRHAREWRRHPVVVHFARLLFNLNPPEHTVVRAHLAPVVSRAAVAAVRPRIEAITEDCLDALADALREGGGTADLMEHVALPFPARVMFAVFGLPDTNAARMAPLTEQCSVVTVPVPSTADLEAAGAAYTRLRAYHSSTVEQLRRSDGPCPPPAWAVSSARGGPATPEETEMYAASLFAGGGTITSLIGSTTRTLLDQPPLADRVRTAPGLITPLVNAMLREEAPAPVTFRVADRARTVAGTAIAENQRVMVALSAAGREARTDGKPSPLLAFGNGAHSCPGAALTYLAMDVYVRALLRRFPTLRLAEHDRPAYKGQALPRYSRLLVTTGRAPHAAGP